MQSHPNTWTHHVGLIEQVSTAELSLHPWLPSQYSGLIWIKKSANICWTIQANVQSAALWHSATRHLISIPEASTAVSCGGTREGEWVKLGGEGKGTGMGVTCFYFCLSIQHEKYCDSYTQMCQRYIIKVKEENRILLLFKQTGTGARKCRRKHKYLTEK